MFDLFDIVKRTQNSFNIFTENGNSVEATFENVEATFEFVAFDIVAGVDRA